MSGLKKAFLKAAAAVLLLCMLAGCGAVINTELTVDKNFAGQRTITLEISNSDVNQYVTGGLAALKSVADSKIPAGLTCATSASGDKSYVTFVLAFSNLNDYRSKVQAILNAGSNDGLMAEIAYENQETYFKKGVKVKENFNSFELLKWYFDALQEANIITYSGSSNWYELGDTTVTVDGTSYSTGNRVSVEEQELCCLDNITVETFINIDGSFSRIFTFETDADIIVELEDKGCDLEEYLSDLTPKGDEFKLGEDQFSDEYIITIEAKDTKELVEKTNKILQTENGFSLDIKPYAESNGMATINVTEKLDGSFYLDGSDIDSNIHLLSNADIKENDYDVSYNDDVLSYDPVDGAEYSFDFDWKIGFASVEIISKINSSESASVEFVFTAEEKLSKELKKSAADALKKTCGKYGEFSKDDYDCTISFSGSVADITEKINKFVGANDEYSDGEYFSISFKEAETASVFTNGYVGEISYNIKPIIGNSRVLFNDDTSFMADYYYQGDFQIDSKGNRTAASVDSVSFTLIEISWFGIILVGAFVIVFLAGAVLLFIERKKIVELVKAIKERPAKVKTQPQVAEAPVTVTEEAFVVETPVEEVSEAQAEQPSEPVVEAPAETASVEPAPVAVAPEEDEEEEIM